MIAWHPVDCGIMVAREVDEFMPLLKITKCDDISG
jgi:hypothetical protein